VTENVGDRARNDTTVSVSLSTSRDCKCLARTSLTIGKDCPVIALEARVDHVRHHRVENTLLLREHVEDPVELEIIVVVLDL